MFESYDDTPSVIVGQWFVPHPHTAVDIEPGERVREVTVWTKTVDKPLPGWYSSHLLVTITGIRICVQASTGSSRTLAFAAPGIDLATLEDESGRSVHWKRAGTDHGDEYNIDMVCGREVIISIDTTFLSLSFLAVGSLLPNTTLARRRSPGRYLTNRTRSIQRALYAEGIRTTPLAVELECEIARLALSSRFRIIILMWTIIYWMTDIIPVVPHKTGYHVFLRR
jgi:hypothetical protein